MAYVSNMVLEVFTVAIWEKKSMLWCSCLMPVLLWWSTEAWAGGVQYELRVDGLACPFCSYGIEKKFKKTPGVTGIEFDLERGLVIVRTAEGVELSEERLQQIVADSGFTLRGVKRRLLESP